MCVSDNSSKTNRHVNTCDSGANWFIKNSFSADMKFKAVKVQRRDKYSASVKTNHLLQPHSVMILASRALRALSDVWT